MEASLLKSLEATMRAIARKSSVHLAQSDLTEATQASSQGDEISTDSPPNRQSSTNHPTNSPHSPHSGQKGNKHRLLRLRGKSDLQGLMARYHDPSIHSQFATEQNHKGLLSLEQARVSLWGRGAMEGLAQNIDATFSQDELYGLICGSKSHPQQAVMEQVAQLRQSLGDQAAFAANAVRLLELLQPPPKAKAKSSSDTQKPPPPPQQQTKPQPSQTTAPRAKRATKKPVIIQAPLATRKRQQSPHMGYRVFTRSYDKIIHSNKQHISTESLASLKEHLANLDTAVARLAARLGRRLLAKRQTHLRLEQEEGLLDSARLARLVSSKATNIFKSEKTEEIQDTVVCLLIDNSGSMRGKPIAASAVCTALLAKVLERCGVAVEILGFTTATWKGGNARKQWLKQGAPSKPGRLNELLHIVYKDAATPLRRAWRNLALMLDENLLKENVDGEALLWALERLNLHWDKRKILLVISDGAPVDDSTLAANDFAFLERHLKEVIKHTEQQVEVCAIGIGHDVGNYYKRAVTISDTEQIHQTLGTTLIGEIESLFLKKQPSPNP